MEEFIGQAFFVFLFLYLIASISLRKYLQRKITQAVKKTDLQALRNLEKEINKRSALYWIFPVTSDLFLSKIQNEAQKIHRDCEKAIGIDIDFLLIEAKDEYENLNGLTTSEDGSEYV